MIQAVIERCAGIDVGKTFIVVCVMTGAAQAEPRVEMRRLGTFNEELENLRLWPLDQGCTHAVMESTGSYWKPIFNILEESIEVILTNAHDVKGHKTDWKDSLLRIWRQAVVPGDSSRSTHARLLRAGESAIARGHCTHPSSRVAIGVPACVSAVQFWWPRL